MTNRLYYTDAYRATFDAQVVSRSEDGLRVYLDESAFYPTSGGQPHDLGTLAGVAVIDVIDEDDRVAHVLAHPLPPAADRVSGAIDWTRRIDNMQQHTGQHLLSAVLDDLYAAKTLSVHFGPEYSTIDVDAESLTPTQILAVEQRANAIVSEARPVVVTFEDAASATGLRKPSDRTGTLRIVAIDAVDRSACGGTHVRTTAEIGPVLLRSVERVRKSTRLEFLCGSRAIRRARRDYEALSAIAASMSASRDDVESMVAMQAERLRDSESARKKLAQEVSAFRVRERYDAAVPNAQGVRTIVIRDAASMDDLKAMAQAAMAMPKVVVVGALATPPSVLVGASDDSGLDAGKTLKAKLAAVGGRGGGSPRLAQGSVPDAAAVDSVIKDIVDRA